VSVHYVFTFLQTYTDHSLFRLFILISKLESWLSIFFFANAQYTTDIFNCHCRQCSQKKSAKQAIGIAYTTQKTKVICNLKYMLIVYVKFDK